MEWVMTCGAPKHRGTKRHHGACVNWRRNISGPRRVVTRTRPRRITGPGDYSEVNRKVFPMAWRDWSLWGMRRLRPPLPHVIDREGWCGGPVGINREFRN